MALKYITSTNGYMCSKEIGERRVNLNYAKVQTKLIRVEVYSDSDANDIVLKVISGNTLSQLKKWGIHRISKAEYNKIIDNFDVYNETHTYDFPIIRKCGITIGTVYNPF